MEEKWKKSCLQMEEKWSLKVEEILPANGKEMESKSERNPACKWKKNGT